jgi:hypothetical protein
MQHQMQQVMLNTTSSPAQQQYHELREMAKTANSKENSVPVIDESNNNTKGCTCNIV